MPKIVDHEEQRERFAAAAIRVVARDGLEGMTMRAVAAEAGLSYGSLFHYFPSKDDLLMEAVRFSTSLQTRRVNDYSSRYRGLKALEQLLFDDALVDGQTRDDAVAWLAFSYKAALEPRFAEMHTELIEGWLERIEGLLAEARERGEIAADADIGIEALAVWAYSAGVGQQALLHPDRLTPRMQRSLIALYLRRLRG